MHVCKVCTLLIGQKWRLKIACKTDAPSLLWDLHCKAQVMVGKELRMSRQKVRRAYGEPSTALGHVSTYFMSSYSTSVYSTRLQKSRLDSYCRARKRPLGMFARLLVLALLRPESFWQACLSDFLNWREKKQKYVLMYVSLSRWIEIEQWLHIFDRFILIFCVRATQAYLFVWPFKGDSRYPFH